jgi:hypothetical protein
VCMTQQTEKLIKCHILKPFNHGSSPTTKAPLIVQTCTATAPGTGTTAAFPANLFSSVAHPNATPCLSTTGNRLMRCFSMISAARRTEVSGPTVTAGEVIWSSTMSSSDPSALRTRMMSCKQPRQHRK